MIGHPLPPFVMPDDWTADQALTALELLEDLLVFLINRSIGYPPP
ncbi:hypothetical protein [Burkholderia cenocepacia]|nr:hypothetical protein [Burkholderia cenocepacia]